MPERCTVEDIRDTYVEGWKMGLKCVAIYRDGSKRSAPLNTKKNKGHGHGRGDPAVDAGGTAKIVQSEFRT